MNNWSGGTPDPQNQPANLMSEDKKLKRQKDKKKKKKTKIQRIDQQTVYFKE